MKILIKEEWPPYIKIDKQDWPPFDAVNNKDLANI